MYNAIIVEDEALASQYLLGLVHDHSNIQVIESCNTGKTAIDSINRHKPAVLFLDIHLPDMSGFEVLQAIDYQPMVIFTTAYEQYAIKAFEAFCVDYLVKPITPDRFLQTIEKLKRVQTPPSFDVSELSNLLHEIKGKKKIASIPITIGDKILLIDCDDITHLSGEDKYVRVHTSSGKSHLCSRTLNQLSDQLPDHFLRIHRSHIVNRNFIAEIRKYFKGKLALHLGDHHATTLTTGAQYTAEVKKVLGI